ncbi:MAG: AfsR/SARP family transcriptional regulator [Acidimicrobiales bacterium]
MTRALLQEHVHGHRQDQIAPPVLPEVVVRVLGPVEVVGTARPFRRAWCLDLVAYLALHPEGARADAWVTALWPDRMPPDATRFSTISDARRALGRAADGADHLPRSVGRLELATSVTTDWAQFRSLAGARGPDAPVAWAAALDLVRGPLLGGLRSSDWAVLEGLVAEMESAIVQLALDAAEHHLARRDGQSAERALRRGLRASPYDERLYRLLFFAADCQGNPSGVESAMCELVRLVSGGVDGHAQMPCGPEDPARWVHPDTLAVYRSVSRRCSPDPLVQSSSSDARMRSAG